MNKKMSVLAAVFLIGAGLLVLGCVQSRNMLMMDCGHAESAASRNDKEGAV